MREVSHRANEPEDFIWRFSEHIQAPSANQGLPVRNGWLGMEVEDGPRSTRTVR
jgi:hypothetical protein